MFLQVNVMQFIRFSFVMLLLGGVFVSPAISEDWPQWRGPHYDLRSAETDWSADNPTILWKANVGIGYSSGTISGTRLLTMGYSDEEEAEVVDVGGGGGRPVRVRREGRGAPERRERPVSPRDRPVSPCSASAVSVSYSESQRSYVSESQRSSGTGTTATTCREALASLKLLAQQLPFTIMPS